MPKYQSKYKGSEIDKAVDLALGGGGGTIPTMEISQEQQDNLFYSEDFADYDMAYFVKENMIKNPIVRFRHEGSYVTCLCFSTLLSDNIEDGVVLLCFASPEESIVKLLVSEDAFMRRE